MGKWPILIELLNIFGDLESEPISTCHIVILNFFVWTLTLLKWKTKLHEGKNIFWYFFVDIWLLQPLETTHFIRPRNNLIRHYYLSLRKWTHLFLIHLFELWSCSNGKQKCTKVKNNNRDLPIINLLRLFLRLGKWRHFIILNFFVWTLTLFKWKKNCTGKKNIFCYFF